MTELPLAGVRVLELAQGIAGPYGAKLLADLGAEIVKVEPTGGDPSRSWGPFAHAAPDPERSGLFMYINAGKQSVVLDLATDVDRDACLQLAATADILLESFSPGYLETIGLGSEALHAARPSLVVVSVTPFGQWGPRAAWRGNDLIAAHSSGFAYSFPALQVDSPDLAPLTTPTFAADFFGGQIAAAAAMHGLLIAQQSGKGSHLDVSLQEAMATANNSRFNSQMNSGEVETERVFSEVPTNTLVAMLPCADGWVAISPREEHQWARWLDVMGGPAWANDARFATRKAREEHWSELYPLLEQWSRTRNKTDVFEAAQARRVACYTLGTATDLIGSPQLAARDFFVELDDPELPGVTLPGRPYHLANPQPVCQRRSTRAPRLGEHTAAVLAERAGGVPIPGADSAAAASTPAMLRPLEGLRVVDFSWVLTGPICTRTLAALGAEVIKIESAARADLSQRGVSWEELNPSKRSITLNLKEEQACELARELIARSHVVVENFSTGVMERLGLDYPRLRTINPGIIMASSSALGRTGPERERVAYGTLIQCFTGWATLSAHPGLPPRSAGGVWTDPLTAAFETLLVLTAVWRQRATGIGGFYDLSMAETTIAALPEPILAWCLNQEVMQPRGNRHPVWAPQGCYPAAGNDRWVALSVQSDAEWASLCRLIERPDLLAQEQLTTAAGRREQHAVVDAAIAAWTIQRDSSQTAQRLQEHGIAAASTLQPAELLHDAHLAARAFTSRVEQLDGGVRSAMGIPWLIQGQRPADFRRPPRLGQDNAHVFRELLGLADEQYAQLVAQRVIY